MWGRMEGRKHTDRERKEPRRPWLSQLGGELTGRRSTWRRKPCTQSRCGGLAWPSHPPPPRVPGHPMRPATAPSLPLSSATASP